MNMLQKILSLRYLSLFLVVALLLAALSFGRGVPFVGRELRWSIGIYTARSPWGDQLQPAQGNPVLTVAEINDVSAEFVADPFMIRSGDTWYLFFEILNRETGKGDIGLAVSDDGVDWKYKGVVLAERFHLSYPYVFSSGGQYFMIPETHEDNAISLYRAVDFPSTWEPVGKLLQGRPYVDSSIFRTDDKWWLFAAVDDTQSFCSTPQTVWRGRGSSIRRVRS